MMKPTLNIEMDTDLRPGIGYCRLSDGREVMITVPDQTPPRSTVSVRLSVEDYGRLIGAVANPAI